MNTLFLISMVLETIFGIGFLFAPNLLLGPMGVTLDEAATTFARLFGSAIISFPFILYFARKSANFEFKKGVITSMFVYYIVSTILLLITQLKGQMNSMGWSVVGLHIIFTFWFGRFILIKQVETNQ
jgi:hypothetical protein